MPVSNPVKALIFDMDGTLVDNMGFHDRAWAEWHKCNQLPFDAETFFVRTAGRANAEIFAEMLPDANAERIQFCSEEKEAIYRELYRPALATIAGLDRLLNEASERGLKLAVATSAPKSNIGFTLDGVGLANRFETIVNPGPGLRGKPEPDLFLEAARRLGVLPSECVVFEDAPFGIEAARRAEMRCVAVATTLPASSFSNLAHVVAVVSDFSTLTFSDEGIPLARPL